eukprot:CAMPEP_0115282008 /NCGR_PEP_ID=MMETSP0270-20121206/59617_1 /TAXON_ID=71861 /ORGANISM="Scrippsiella trochoidea, Strain CCMP3099" /LENGTH=149 /DNA_ID=CAMNT_0002698833 /DNA_START=58 /DNA_END=507 /DNA_ORIENTATION=-
MAVILFLVVDLACSAMLTLLEDTDLLNPKYESEGERVVSIAEDISLTILVLFLLEIGLSIVAFRCAYFGDVWHLLDFVVVSCSLLLEVFHHVADADGTILVSAIIGFGRLWRLFAFGFDVVYLKRKVKEMENKDLEEAEITEASSDASA